VGNEVVNNPSQFEDAVEDLEGTGEIMLLLRDVKTGRVGYIVVPLT
jgi:hypothetical protein